MAGLRRARVSSRLRQAAPLIGAEFYFLNPFLKVLLEVRLVLQLAVGQVDEVLHFRQPWVLDGAGDYERHQLPLSLPVSELPLVFGLRD